MFKNPFVIRRLLFCILVLLEACLFGGTLYGAILIVMHLVTSPETSFLFVKLLVLSVLLLLAKGTVNFSVFSVQSFLAAQLYDACAHANQKVIETSLRSPLRRKFIDLLHIIDACCIKGHVQGFKLLLQAINCSSPQWLENKENTLRMVKMATSHQQVEIIKHLILELNLEGCDDIKELWKNKPEFLHLLQTKEFKEKLEHQLPVAISKPRKVIKV